MNCLSTPRILSLASLAAGTHARFFSQSVAPSIIPPGVNSVVKCFHVSSAPEKKALITAERWGRFSFIAKIAATAPGLSHFNPSSAPVS